MEVFILFLDPFFTTKFFGYTLLWLYCFFFFLSIVLLISFQLRVCFVVMWQSQQGPSAVQALQFL